MRGRLALGATVRFLAGVIIIGALLFIPFGGLLWTRAYLFMAVAFLPIAVCGAVLLLRSPALLEKRLGKGEKDKGQRRIVALSALAFLLAFVTAGLSARFGFLVMPMWVSVFGCVSYILGYVLYALVLSQNRFLSRNIEVQDGQTVCDTGLYALVRHPMYLATVIMFLSMPLILGSFVSLLIMCIYPVLIAQRIKGEERLLEEELSGYAEYKKKVKYRLIPYIW